MRLSRYGITVELPPRWEGRIYKRPEGHPILHSGTFALPAQDGDFGSEAIGQMGPSDVFAALLEYDPALAFTGIFAPSGLPLPLREADTDPRSLQRLLRGRTAVQRFFTESSRPFCLYAVFSSGPGLPQVMAAANRVLETVAIEPRRAEP